MVGIVSKNAFRLRNKKISATAPTDKQVLRYDAATDQYVPDSLSDFAPSVHTHSASDIASGVFGVNRGGTGLSTIASGKLLYASADDVLSELSLGSTLAISSGVLNVQNNTSTQKIEVAKADVLIGTRKRINFVEGSNITLTINDDNVNDRVDITIAASGGSTTHNLLSATHPDTVVASPVLGDIIYANSTPAWTKLAGNTTTTKKFLTQTGTGTESAAPAWDTIAATDLPSHTHSAADITSGTLAVARGGTGQNFSAAAQGSIIYFSAAGTMATLPPGTAGQFLKTQGAGANPVWADVGGGTDLFSLTEMTFSFAPVVLNPGSAPAAGSVSPVVSDGQVLNDANGVLLATSLTANTSAQITAYFPNSDFRGFNKKIKLRVWLNFSTNRNTGVSLSGFGDAFNIQTATKFCRFRVAGSDLYAETKNGTTTTSVNITAAWGTLTNKWRTTDIIFTPGTSAAFYRDGALLATITTNLPPDTDTTSENYYGAYVTTGESAHQTLRIGKIIFSRAF
jgi:hypothetical protein